MITYEQLAERLAVDLAFLKPEDFINFHANGRYTQVIQDPDRVSADLMANRPLTETERQFLVDAGWETPTPPGQPLWLYSSPWPLTGTGARHLADMIVSAVQEIISPDITQVEYEARNYDTGEENHPPSLASLRRAAPRPAAP